MKFKRRTWIKYICFTGDEKLMQIDNPPKYQVQKKTLDIRILVIHESEKLVQIEMCFLQIRSFKRVFQIQCLKQLKYQFSKRIRIQRFEIFYQILYFKYFFQMQYFKFFSNALFQCNYFLDAVCVLDESFIISMNLYKYGIIKYKVLRNIPTGITYLYFSK